MNNNNTTTEASAPADKSAQSDKKTYSAPAMERRIDGWPFGRFERCQAVFKIEQHPTRGERAVRTITDGDGRTYTPKKLTYAAKARIVEGSDGRTYIAELTRCGNISIMRGDMKYSEEFMSESDPRAAAVLALFN